MLNAMASWLEDSNNEALLLAEHDDECLKLVAEACISAASILKKAGDETDKMEELLHNIPEEHYEKETFPHPIKPEIGIKTLPESSIMEIEEIMRNKGISNEDLEKYLLIQKEIELNKNDINSAEEVDELSRLAALFDKSEDENLKKYAAVIDELLLTIATPPNTLSEKLAANEKKVDELARLYQNPRKSLEEQNKIADSEEAIAKSPISKEYKILEAPLSSRCCPDHAGVQLGRKGDHLFQCELDNKIYDFGAGYTLADGTKVPGGDVSEQTKGLNEESHSIFDTRENRLQTNKL